MIEHPIDPNAVVTNLLTHLNAEMELSDLFNPAITPMLQPVEVKKLQQVLQRGQVPEVAYWLEGTYARAYFDQVTADGLEVQQTGEFYRPMEIMVDANGFFNGAVSDCCIEIAPGGVMVPFSKGNFSELKLSAPEAVGLAKRILAKQSSRYREKMMMLRLPCEQRVARFKELFGIQIWHAFAQKHIASYLGMTPEHLSRLF
ncbi:hypothetical protein [Pedobacter sp. JY14-1]|uniref:Crp/Fnr family transcriptional regulator n=1 Tax=Pedobacter sp. JY14-1 TaxID=3034151 RepID=UPI0023E345B7|nr:hypothetical protein [Pedobacter sp. JY14-1]